MRYGRMALATALVGAAIAAMAPAGLAQQNARGDALASSDFVTRSLLAAERNKALLALAVERAEYPAVRRFAETVARDLEESEKRLSEIKRRDGSAATGEAAEIGSAPDVPAAEVPYKRREYHRLRALYGRAFDRQFMRGAVVSYEKAIRRYEAEAERAPGGGEEATRAYAAERLPSLRQRLDEARALLAEIERPR